MTATRRRHLPTLTRFPFQGRMLAAKVRTLIAAGRPRLAARELATRGALLAINRIGWALDDLIMPGWAAVEVRGPIFIVGHQRSGTTFLHRLLVDALPDAVGLRLGAMLVPPLVWRRLASQLVASSPMLRAWLDDRQATLFGPLDDVHHTRWDGIEEDEFAFWTIYASAMVANDLPETSAASALGVLRDPAQWPSNMRDMSLDYYLACLRKNVVANHLTSGLAVAKNPVFGKIIPQLAARFPEALFVHLVRDPLRAIPSRLRMVEAIWQLRNPGQTLDADQIQALVADSLHIYTATHEGMARLAPGRGLTFGFEQLIQQPEQVVAAIAKHVQSPLAAGLQGAIAKHARREISARPIRDYGLDVGWITRHLASVLDLDNTESEE